MCGLSLSGCSLKGEAARAVPAPYGTRPPHFTALTSSVLNAGWSWTLSSCPSVIPTMRAVRWVVTQTAGCGCLNLHAGRRFGQHLDGRRAGRDLVRLGVHVIELVLDIERGRHARHDGVVPLHRIHRELRDAVVAAGPAAGDGRVQLRPLRVAVPRARVQHHEALAGRREVHERLAIRRRIEELTIDADHGDVGLPDLGRRLIAVLSVVHAEAGGCKGGDVGAAEELAEVVRAAAADDQHLQLARCPDDRPGLGQRRIAAAALLRAWSRSGRRGRRRLARCRRGRLGRRWLAPRKLRMSRSASAPSASNPSGISERRVFSRVAMSSFLISTSPAGPRSVTLASFSRAITPTSDSFFRVVMFHCQKLGSTSRLGSTTCASSSARGWLPMPARGGPTSLPTSPSLWQLAHAPVNSALPFAASPGLSTSGSSAATMSALALPAGRQRVEQGDRLLRDLAVRMGAQPRDVGRPEVRGRELPFLHRVEQRQRGGRALEDLIEDENGVGARQRRRPARHRRPGPA